VEAIGHLLSSLRARPEPEQERSEREARQSKLIEQLARAIVARRLEAPAALFLELNRPLGFIFSQTAFFARPFLSFFLPAADVESAAEILDDPKALDRLLDRIGEISTGEGA
jgi:hypothetical protein